MTELRPRTPRLRDPAYLAWLRKQPCSCGCRRPAPSDAAHIRSGNIVIGKDAAGAGEKPSDCWAVPLNRACHMRQHDHGDELGWWQAHGKNPFALAMHYYGQFRIENPKAREAKVRAKRKIKPRKPRGQRAKICSRNTLRRRR